MEVITPLLRRRLTQTHTGPTNTNTRVDLDLPYNQGIIIKQYLVEVQNSIADDSQISMGISQDPDVAPTSLALLADGIDTLRVFTWEQEFTTSGKTSIQNWAEWKPPWNEFFKAQGFLIMNDISFHMISSGASIAQAGTHRLFYERVRLTNSEVALLGIRARG